MNNPCSDAPLVTVVIPVYNRESLLPEAITSVIQQTYQNWELFVVDDGSTDHTVQTAHSFSDPRIHVIVLPHMGNIGMLRNVGIRAGSGKWLAFLDSDDAWTTRRLEVQVKSLSACDACWGYGRYNLVNENGEVMAHRAQPFQPMSGWITREIITSRAAVSIGSLMVERKLFEALNGFSTDPQLLFREDYDFAIRLSVRAKAVAVNEVLVHIREHRNRSTRLFDEGHLRTAQTCHHLLEQIPEPALKMLLRRKKAFHLAEASVQSCKKRKYRYAGKQVWEALVEGDQLGHLFSVGYRCAGTLISNGIRFSE